MRQADVPRGVAADRVAGKEYAVGVDGEPPAGVAERVQYGDVFAGRIAVISLVLDRPHGRDDDVPLARGLAGAGFVALPPAGPPINLQLGRPAGSVEREDGRVEPIGIVFGRKLHVIRHRLLFFQSRHLDLIIARFAGHRVRRIDGRFHVRQQIGHHFRIRARIVLEVVKRPLPFQRDGLRRILSNHAADPVRRDGGGKIDGRGVGAQQPTADGQRELLIVGHLGVVGVLQERRHAVERVEVDAGGDFFQDRSEIFPRDGVGHALAERLQVLDDVLSTGLADLILLDHVAHALEDLPSDALGGKLCQLLPDQAVLAGVVPQL